MSPSDESQDRPPASPKAPRRAKIACKACNARRVRCDAAQSHPCWHCRNRQTVCELIDSRRGKYVRTGRHRSSTSSSARVLKLRDEPDPSISIEPPSSTIVPDRSPQDASPNGRQPRSLRDIDAHFAPDGMMETEDTASEGPEMLYARMTDPTPRSEPSPPGSDKEPTTLYLGEAFSLAFVVKTVCAPSGNSEESSQLHFPIPPSVEPRSGRRRESNALPRLDDDILALLRIRGALNTPVKEFSDAFIRVFFRSFHPAYPVFDRKRFEAQYRDGTVSLLVLQTIFYIATTICEDELLREAGFDDRQQARTVFYRRAKLLYDADYEDDKTWLVAVLFLLGFWWEKPQDEKDGYHWLGCAVSLAQTVGLHRSTANSGLSSRTRSLWKRIWWSIYIRDRHAAAALGRPCRVHDEDCDVEQLVEEDFEVDIGASEPLMAKQERYHVLYTIEMSKLSVLLGRILSLKFAPRARRDEGVFASIDADVCAWQKQLPVEMSRLPLGAHLDGPFWAANLYANYHAVVMLLNRPTSVFAQSSEQEKRDQLAIQAADECTRIGEDLLTAGAIRESQMHLIPAIFAALSMHLIVIRRNTPIRRQLAENRARTCMLALSELSKSWPVGEWILRLFVTLMYRLTGRESGFETGTRWTSPAAEQVPTRAKANISALVPRQSAAAASLGPGEASFGPPPFQNFSDTTFGFHSLPTYPPDQALYDFDFMFQNFGNHVSFDLIGDMGGIPDLE